LIAAAENEEQESMVKRLKQFVHNLENSRISFMGFLITFFCIVFMRNFLETFSDQDNLWTPVSSLAYFIHYPMFYLCLILALSIIFHSLTKEKIEKTAKIMLFFFPLVLLAPTLDLLLSRGHGYNMSYLFGDLPYLIRKFTTFSWGYSGRGATPGMQIELIVALLLAGCYLFLKTGKVIASIVGVIVSYTAGFVLGSMPSIMALLGNLNGSAKSPQEMFGAEVVLYHFYSFNHKMGLVFYPVLLAELGVWFWLYDRRKFSALVKNLRGLRVFHYLCMLGIGMFIGYSRIQPMAFFDSLFPLFILNLSACAGVLAWLWSVGVNDLYDLDTDKISNHSRPLVTGVINQGEYRALNMVFLLLSLGAAVLVRYPFFVTILLAIGLTYLYSAPPFRLKRIPILSAFILALCSALVCLAGFVLFSDDYSFHGFPPNILLAILCAYTLGLAVIDIKDLNGDRITGTATLPNLLGEKKGKRVVGILAWFAYLSVPLILKCFILMPFALLFGTATFILINRKQMRETPVFVLYFLFLAVTLYFIYPQIQGG
jgi:4-hydroxybenzoate polyprenyltransferase